MPSEYGYDMHKRHSPEARVLILVDQTLYISVAMHTLLSALNIPSFLALLIWISLCSFFKTQVTHHLLS